MLSSLGLRSKVRTRNPLNFTSEAQKIWIEGKNFLHTHMNMVIEATAIELVTLWGPYIEQGRQEKRVREGLVMTNIPRQIGRKATLILRNSKGRKQRE